MGHAVKHRRPHLCPPFHPVRPPSSSICQLLPASGSPHFPSGKTARPSTARGAGNGGRGGGSCRPGTPGGPRGRPGAGAGGAPSPSGRRRGRRPRRLRDCASAPRLAAAPGMRGGGGDGHDAQPPASAGARAKLGVRAARMAEEGAARRPLRQVRPRAPGGGRPRGDRGPPAEGAGSRGSSGRGAPALLARPAEKTISPCLASLALRGRWNPPTAHALA